MSLLNEVPFETVILFYEAILFNVSSISSLVTFMLDLPSRTSMMAAASAKVIPYIRQNVFSPK